MTEPLRLKWQRCRFSDSGFRHLERISGVCVIWEKEPGRVIYVGRGNLEERVSKQLNDKNELTSLVSRGNTWVFYAEVAEEKQAGVENFLIQHYEPTYGQIEVNLPDFHLLP
ncbi:MAG: hypothetical protein F4X55_02660 [Candidatus Dadabacteria bacterium]|nr:hypothetical protein [Candidatus Dadabacteria bacterium]MYC39902.1 hypothetical protein [Candidatus Dadabacteria bacterium]